MFKLIRKHHIGVLTVLFFTLLPTFSIALVTSRQVDVQSEVDTKNTGEEPVTEKSTADNSLEVISVDPNSPAILKLGEKLNVDIRYHLRSFTDVRIWARPYTKGRRSRGSKTHGSKIYSKTDSETGIAKGYFFFDKPTSVDEIRVRMEDKNTGESQTASYKIDVRWIDVNPGVKDNDEVTGKKPEKEPIYDSDADANKQINDALAKAKRDNKHVLLMYGGNWCGWCYKLHDCFKKNTNIKKLLRYEYELVMIDINSNKGLPGRFNAKPDGYPYLTVLNSKGKVLVNQSTVPFEKRGAHNPDKVYNFLSKWKPEHLDADEVYEKALTLAAKENKLVFLYFGAPWCGWCHRLDDFLARPEISGIMKLDYVLVKIDLDRMTGAKDLDKRIRQGKGGGIPWYAILDTKGKLLINSVGPRGNFGYPARPEGIAHFIHMLKKTAKSMSSEQISTIEKTLRLGYKHSSGH